MSNFNYGVGVVTCNRADFLAKCVDSIPEGVDIVVVNDGSDRTYNFNKKPYIIENPKNLGVGRSKNKAFRYLLDKGHEHIFIIEDDMLIKDPSVFDRYIEAARKTGLGHLNFGYHGPANKGGVSKGTPQPRFIVDYGNDIRIAINMHGVGSFCYYSKKVLDACGLMDEQFQNAFEHIDHDYVLHKAGYYTPHWNFADLADSWKYIDEQACSEESSSIRPRADWMRNIQNAAQYFHKKHGMYPAWQGGIPDTSEEDVKKCLKEIYKKHAIKEN